MKKSENKSKVKREIAISLTIFLLISVIVMNGNFIKQKSSNEIYLGNQDIEITKLNDEKINNLKSETFSDEEISAAEMLIDRVQLQLEEIVQDNGNIEDKLINPNNEDETCKTLLEKFDAKKAVYLILKLKKDFGSCERVLDEYLYSIQIGIDLELYITDKKEYEREKSEKTVEYDISKLITLEKIEQKLISKMKENNEKTNDKVVTNNNNLKGDPKSNYGSSKNEETTIFPLTETNNKVKNPASDILQEINDINMKSLNLDGR